jgi:hypothetical protein
VTVPLHALPLAQALEVRRQRGIDTYRGGDASRPFVGDAAAEAFEEALDLVVYSAEMLRQGEARAEVEHVARLALEVVGVLGELLRSRAS